MLALLMPFILSSLARVVDVDAASNFDIMPNANYSAEISSNPSAGIVWAMISDDVSKMNIPDPHGVFYVNTTDNTKGFQKIEFECKNCVSGEETYALFVLKRPWKNDASLVRKITFNVK
jgi:predicted secreted protein